MHKLIQAVLAILTEISDTYSKVNSRMLALIILVASIGTVWFWSYSLFVKNVSILDVVVTGPETATVQLLKSNAVILSTQCKSRCYFNEVPAFDYDLRVSADGYRSETRKVSIRNKSKLLEAFELVRDVKTVDFRVEKSDAIGEIKAKRAVLSESGALDTGRNLVGRTETFHYLVETKPSFRLYSRNLVDGIEKDLFVASPGSDLKIVSNEEDSLFWIETPSATAFVDFKNGTVSAPALPPTLTKISRTFQSGTFILTDKDNAYSYDKSSNQYVKRPAYSDYVFFPDGKIIGLVRKGDISRASLLNLPDSNASYLILDTAAAARKSVFKSDRVIKNIALVGFNLVIEYENGDKEVLKNYD